MSVDDDARRRSVGEREDGRARHGAARAPRASPSVACGECQPVALVVDDEPSVRAVVARHLIRLGWAVRALPSAEAALAWLGEAADVERPQLVVSDIDMPGLTGVDLAAILRRDHPALGVLLLSGRADPGLTPLRLPGARAQGTDAEPPVWVLGKPYALRSLGEAVERSVLRHWGAPTVGEPS